MLHASRCSQLFAVLLGAFLAVGHSVTPVEKVLDLLVSLKDKVSTEGTNEAAQYDKFACFCKAQADDKVHAIAKSNEIMDTLNAAIDEASGSIAQLDADAATLKEEVENERAESREAGYVRSNQTAEFLPKRDDLTGAIDAVERAMASLQQSKSNIESAALIQKAQEAISKVTIRGASVSLPHFFAQKHHSSMLRAWSPAPAAAVASDSGTTGPVPVQSYDGPAYRYRSNDVIATLQGLARTFRAELARISEEESAAQHDHNMVEGARANKIKAMEADIREKEMLSAQKSQEMAANQKSLADETAARNADQSFLDALTQTCETKATQWDQRSNSRASELTALTQGIEALKGMGDLYSVNKKLTGLVQRKASKATVGQHKVLAKMPSFMQVSEVTSTKQVMFKKVIDFLKRQATTLNSESLFGLVYQLSQADDHFVKVRGIIKDLIARLEADAEAEATQKSFCDEQMSQSIQQRDEKAADIESLTAQIQSTKSTIASLEHTIEQLTNQLAQLHQAMSEMTELRNAEKAQNEKAIEDAATGSQTVRQAIIIIKEYYGMELIQVAAPAPAGYTPYRAPGADREGNTVGDLAPDVFEGEYQGKFDESTGIVGLLEVIASDFERTKAQTEQDEQLAQEDYEAEVTRINGEIDSTTTEKETKEGELSTEQTNLVGYQDDLQSATQLHEEAIASLETLKASCVEGEESYEQRVEARKKEIEALKQALAILEDWKA